MLAALISQISGTNQLQTLAQSVASHSLESVWYRVRMRLPTLGVNEARGYVRARAIAIIRSQIDEFVSDGTIAERFRDRVARIASELVVQGTMDRFAAAPLRTSAARRAA